MTAKRTYHHGNLRAALIAVALKEVARSGPESFSLREVARRAGVSAPAVYRHFADKEALLAAVAAECSERIEAALTAAVAAAGPDPLERFRATGIAYVQFAVEHPEHFRAISAEWLAPHTPHRQHAASERRLADERAALSRAQADGLIVNVPLDDMMLAAVSITHGLAQLILEGRLGKVDAARAKQLAITVTAMLGIGFAPRVEPYEDALSGIRVKPRSR